MSAVTSHRVGVSTYWLHHILLSLPSQTMSFTLRWPSRDTNASLVWEYVVVTDQQSHRLSALTVISVPLAVNVRTKRSLLFWLSQNIPVRRTVGLRPRYSTFVSDSHAR